MKEFQNSKQYRSISATETLSHHHERWFCPWGHSRAYKPRQIQGTESELSEREGKNVRRDEEGPEFIENSSLVPWEEEWMGEEVMQHANSTPPLRSFSKAVKGGRKPIIVMKMEEDGSFSSLKKEDMESSNEEVQETQGQNTREGERNQKPDIIVEQLLGRRISLLVFSRRLEAVWEKQNTIASWKRLPGLDIKYYEEDMLKRIGNVVRTMLKVDANNTTRKTRKKFAKLCIQLDLTEPLLSYHFINRAKYMVEYKGSYNICFSCGMVSHEKASCPKNKGAVEKGAPEAAVGECSMAKKLGERNVKSDQDNPGDNKSDKGKRVMEVEENGYGPWMMVQRITHGKQAIKFLKVQT
ncbi:hypothetical protein Ahy_B03g063745 [Arachis hypogaea]|uniref:Uncharacterized protein n=1 Tax=Arachis hypogaea TaxID=3818 RepID=A0A444ZY08_ARAHY|nr:hypothetical protein Ahy_B03g063745 [Arachis hypogaea]